MFKLSVNTLLTLLSIAYPLCILCQPQAKFLSYFAFGLSILWLFKSLQAVKFLRLFAIFISMILLLVVITRTFNLMYWYPVVINSIMLISFGGSLWAKQTFVERLARLQTPNLPFEAVAYTRKVTQIWCGIFILNIVMSSGLILFEQIELWAFYTGGVAYFIMGAVMLIEWIVRPKYK